MTLLLSLTGTGNSILADMQFDVEGMGKEI